jgi:hypothetical protein
MRQKGINRGIDLGEILGKEGKKEKKQRIQKQHLNNQHHKIRD